MPKFIDNFLNKTTMYRLVLYVLIFFFVASLVLSFFQLLPYTLVDLAASAGIIIVASWITNFIFARVFQAPTNVESVYITALILFCIITPPRAGDYSQYFALALWACVWAMASKYILAVRKKHIFNPAAFAVALTVLTINESASWWIGTMYMLPFVLIGGALVVRKIRRAHLVVSFVIVALITIVGFAISRGADPITAVYKTLIDSAFFFFAFVMLTEPMTTPPTKWLRVLYGALVGFLFAPAVHIGGLYSTPEFALVVGNVFSYLVSPKEKLILRLKERVKAARDTFDFVFTDDHKLNFRPGQYMEWTLARGGNDSRGARRYFTLASSPTENDLRIGVKFYPEPSSFKKHLASLEVGDEIVASQRAGDFLLPRNTSEKLVFMAGGIGITPFRSMVQYLLDRKEKRSIIMFYSNKTESDIAYKNIFDRASVELGMKAVYVNTDQSGYVNAEMIRKEAPDYQERTFYLSGPHAMVTAFEETLESMGVSRKRIKTDYFPGFA